MLDALSSRTPPLPPSQPLPPGARWRDVVRRGSSLPIKLTPNKALHLGRRSARDLRSSTVVKEAPPSTRRQPTACATPSPTASPLPAAEHARESQRRGCFLPRPSMLPSPGSFVASDAPAPKGVEFDDAGHLVNRARLTKLSASGRRSHLDLHAAATTSAASDDPNCRTLRTARGSVSICKPPSGRHLGAQLEAWTPEQRQRAIGGGATTSDASEAAGVPVTPPVVQRAATVAKRGRLWAGLDETSDKAAGQVGQMGQASEVGGEATDGGAGGASGLAHNVSWRPAPTDRRSHRADARCSVEVRAMT